MRQYIYVSNAAPDFRDDELERIMETSCRRNGEDGITGFLLFNGRNFLQLVEGDHTVVEVLVTRLHQDERHSGIRALEDREVAERSCPDWSMNLLPFGGTMDEKRQSLDARLPVGLAEPQRGLVLNFARLT